MAYTLTYTDINSEETSLTGYTGTPEGDLVVPDVEGGKKVVSIGPGAFLGTAITSVDIGENVREIGQGAFDSCEDNLSAITGGENVEEIKTSAFGACYELVSIPYMPKLRIIGTYAFASCSKLVEFIIPESVLTIGTDAFSDTDRLEKIIFSGNAPVCATETFRGTSAIGYVNSWATGFTNPFYDLPIFLVKRTAVLYPSGYDSLALSMWGINLGVKRPSYGTPAVPFSDQMYSRLLLSRIMLMNMSGSMADINRYLAFLFPDKNVIAIDGQDMTITYLFPEDLTDEETALISVDGVLPRPQGVLSNVLIDSSDKTTFGFYGQQAGNFDNSVFVTET